MKDINLIPAELKEQKMRRKKQLSHLFFVFALITIIFALIAFPMVYINELYQDLKYVNNELGKFKDISQLQQNVKDLSLYIDKKKSIIKKLQSQKLDAVNMLENLALNIPEKVSIDVLKYENNILEIDGEAFSESDIAAFMLNLRGLNYVEDVKIESIDLTDRGLLKYILHVKIKVVS
ncbi:Fimbrial assembly family protein [Thermoanaerobacter mathranii subsp. mathranii str. A3]|uniref:Fimbrial assembly family protein n=3 Tax=Thermoanaerobacter TaxID=1754 RepID=D3T8Q2_THEIA|nr:MULTISPECIES: PilN domain-containing protein [Thermoanaerobacter]ADD02334.1 Fimbrial assembly family protein [Thermoanaerobacter italicus Ab9]ADH60840.1 Fimbrial assembly family protein [Thermoanaerobacter mathranii subsp. mathranii str. A3]MBT1279808.1 PilN domain-containing protein [Thermoanaerobacter sp. CM-CNRG TB177]MDP9749659.1 type IV pilus assembly protein PilN [Thermoanaerobacter pentosaceus]